MVDEVTAYKCSLTGKIFEKHRDAVRHEFHTLMVQLFGNMGPLPQFEDYKVPAHWLASNLEGRVYTSAVGKFLEVADYLRANRETLAGEGS